MQKSSGARRGLCCLRVDRGVEIEPERAVWTLLDGLVRARPRVEEGVHHQEQARDPDSNEDQEDAYLPLIHAALHATFGHVRLRCTSAQ